MTAALLPPCPRCARPNAAHRTSCLYCGEAMPDPAPPPPRPAAVAPAELDALVRRALRGSGSAEQVRAALAAGATHAAEEPVATAPLAPGELAEPLPSPEEAIAGVTVAADAVREAWAAVDLAGAARALRALAEATDAASAAVAALAAPSPVELPPIRLPFALVVSGEVDAARVAEALEVDPATARAIAAAAHTRVALRSADGAELERRAARARDAGMDASVQAREALFALPPATALLGRAEDGAWRVAVEPLWLDGPLDPGARPAGLPAGLDGVFLAVPGEVDARTERAVRAPPRWARQGWTAAGPARERRTGVVDLHLPGRIVRVVEGVSDLRGLPGHDPASAHRSLRGLAEELAALWPDARVEPRRVCAGGWPAWEEHSRLARLHRGE